MPPGKESTYNGLFSFLSLNNVVDGEVGLREGLQKFKGVPKNFITKISILMQYIKVKINAEMNDTPNINI